jgi:hypothetical protein
MDIGVSEYWAQLDGLMAKSLLVLGLVLLLVLLETALGPALLQLLGLYC